MTRDSDCTVCSFARASQFEFQRHLTRRSTHDLRPHSTFVILYCHVWEHTARREQSMVHGARPLFSLLIRDGPQLRTPQNLLSHPRSTCHPHGSWLEPPQSPKPDMDHSWIIVEDLVVTPSDSVRSFAEDSVASHAGSEAVGIGLQSIAVEYGCGV